MLVYNYSNTDSCSNENCKHGVCFNDDCKCDEGYRTAGGPNVTLYCADCAEGFYNDQGTCRPCAGYAESGVSCFGHGNCSDAGR